MFAHNFESHVCSHPVTVLVVMFLFHSRSLASTLINEPISLSSTAEDWYYILNGIRIMLHLAFKFLLALNNITI
jgi:hypothetical protein